MMRAAISASRESLRTINPIRQLTENQFLESIEACDKDLLKVSIGMLNSVDNKKHSIIVWPHPLGDPAIFGNLPPPPAVTEALMKAVASQRYHGMAHSAGVPEVRESVAKQLSKYPSKHSISADVSNIIIYNVSPLIEHAQKFKKIIALGRVHDLWDPRGTGDEL